MNSIKFFSGIFTIILLWSTCTAYAQNRDFTIIRDTEIETVLRDWGTPIFKAAGLNPNAINIILVQNDSMNAFVAGGTNIFFYTGLIEKTDNPGELIGVLAHETGHISGGHLIKTREALERASYEAIIGTILGVGAAVATGDGGALSALSLGGQNIAQRRFLAHSRIHESSADQAALTFLEKTQMNPTGMLTFMEKLNAENYLPVNQQSEYIRTHPLIDNRLQALKHRTHTSPFKNTDYAHEWTEQHRRIIAKLIGFTKPGQVQWAYNDKDNSIAAQYARTIASYRLNHIDKAITQINALIDVEPQNPYFHELKGQMLFDFGKINESTKSYQKSLSLQPDAGLIRIALAHTLIESKNKAEYDQAITLLERALQDEPRSARAHRLLATAYGKTGRNNAAKIHLAEEALLQRNFSYARQHAEYVIANEQEGTSLWVNANDIISFVKIVQN